MRSELADYADEEGSCFPGQEKIAERVACSVDTVARSLKTLEDAGLLRREKRRNESGYRTSDRFFLAVGSQPRNLPGSDLTRNGEDSCPANAPILTPQIAGVSPSSNPQIDPSENMATVAAASEIDDEFEEWWKLYPRKAGKGQARKAYRSARKKIGRAGRDVLTAGVVRFAEQTRANGTEQQFIAHASTWLNGERWLDEPEQPRIQGSSPASRALSVDLGGSSTLPEIGRERGAQSVPSILGELEGGRW